ncbi:MAG: fluoride efflux transporter CrcB [Actinomycetota bacterium]
MRSIVGVAIAGAAGAVARYGLGGWIAERLPVSFPWDTLVVNVTGSFVLGLLFVLTTERFAVSPAFRAALTIGFVGAYTTFSTFSLETFRLVEDGAWWLAAANVMSSIVFALAAVAAGVAVGRSI